jgi:DNA-binding transcriptional MerR regulator
MTQWYVKDIAKLTQVSTQTLHHYDRIGLLEPSVRLENGYRLYSEKDLLKLQQIIALKFFGFELSQIKMLLAGAVDMIDHFAIQSTLLAEKANTLMDASKTLKNILANCSHDKSIPWKTIIKLIEVYRMTQQLENSWVSKALSPEELKEYATFEQEFKTRFTPSEKASAENEWLDIVKEVNANLDKNPAGKIGIAIGKHCMDWVNKTYGKKYASLRTSIWDKGYKGGYNDTAHGLTSQSITWLDQAIDGYYRNRIYTLLDQVETHATEKLSQAWNDLLTDMYGDEKNPRDALFEAAMKDEKVSTAAREWLKKIMVNNRR